MIMFIKCLKGIAVYLFFDRHIFEEHDICAFFLSFLEFSQLSDCAVALTFMIVVNIYQFGRL